LKKLQRAYLVPVSIQRILCNSASAQTKVPETFFLFALLPSFCFGLKCFSALKNQE